MEIVDRLFFVGTGVDCAFLVGAGVDRLFLGTGVCLVWVGTGVGDRCVLSVGYNNNKGENWSNGIYTVNFIDFTKYYSLS